ncbi:hypothetical protein B0T21DRAFT_411387 [Apiosordaria backusii]|uniref:DUF7580 domain-containing protein n=1 Tax=Apiosordaria backusii TaxID=314023 RepID=A0AA40BL99_9PEZI|nr:hypothetical protein B0T21DRAFT_411387 [Apiosordaria backusii]
MEVAGVVLGSLPIILHAIDNYHRCVQATTDYWRYESTIKLIRNHVFVQQQQLQITLRSIGLVDPSPTELEEYIRYRYPDKCDIFIDIVTHIHALLSKLMDKLDITPQGKPRWTTDPPNRVTWEWRRVRRGFSRSSRQKLIDELQFWNDALKACFEKEEVPLETDTPNATLEAIRAKFSMASCNTIREHALQIHHAVSQAWRCHSHDHPGNLRISWHTDGQSHNGRLSLFFTSSPSNSVTQSWQEVVCNVIQPPIDQTRSRSVSPLLTPGLSSNAAPSQPAVDPVPSPRPWKRMKTWLQTPSKDDHQGVHPLSLLCPRSDAISMHTTLPTMDLPNEITCLCSFLHSAERVGRLGIPSTRSEPLHVCVERRETSHLQQEAISLGNIFGPSRQSTARTPLTRTDRFAVAAAATWAVLYLAGSPWVDTQWSGKDGFRLFTESQSHHPKYYPAISYTFNSAGGVHQDTPTNTRVSQFASTEEIKVGIIRNKTLFALGILFIELCLDKSLETLREEFHADSLTSSLGVGARAEDYEVANKYVQSVYLEAGDWYGYAVQRCLRCEFPGRDVTKTFEFEQFRNDFFTGVVAPIQATFNILQALHGGLQTRL